MDSIKYLVSFKTKRSACMVRVNGFPVFDNFTYSSGTIAAGDNITSFIENGKNKIEVLMGSVDSQDKDTLYSDSECEFTITRDTIDSSENVTTIKLSVDDDKNIIATLSSNYDGFKHEGQMIEEQLPEDDWLYLHRFYRDIEFSGIKKWSWVGADRMVSEKDLPIIQAKYREIWQAMRDRDVKALKKMAAISSEEMGDAEGISPDIVFESYDLPKNVLDANLTPIDLEWKKYKLTTYCNGRVFRLSSGIYENSPLRLKNKNDEIVYSYTPYFSIINGKVVIVR
ncbi:hypothetical protein OY03_002750 [Salmonella enterica subsp. enterica]|nr:hypothetical protein [Salmonella enterica subsp. enterica]EAY9757677.1 hypothetical protein [Salmonella enterica]EBY6258696.1 hypothetical protein [Salmonella enterica subsp. enterica serovar Warnow]ECD6357079.1 hypothetical protein [Salmonella enterica subsp. enterica serovar Othmarschen]EDV3946845.1 hypothetical protein [Salmonella enterica subsp. enterica serovar Warragul]